MPQLYRGRATHGVGWLIGSVFLLSTTGCANLAAVRSFAETSAATVSYTQVVGDYVGSPAWQKDFAPPRSYASFDKETASRQQQRIALEQVQKVLTEYMSALGDMAADELPSADNEIGSLATALVGNNLVNAQTATSASAIARLLTTAVNENWRQRKVKTLVTATDPHVQQVVAGLKVLVRASSISFATERESVNAFFIDITPGFAGPEQQRLLQLLQKQQLRPIDAREKNLQAYDDALTKIAAGHTYLRDHISKPQAAEVRKQLSQYAKDLQAIYKSLVKPQS